ncbi:MAG: hypothetical protein ABH834_08180 [Candidatus Altiarchaeota archaeon]
MKTVRRVAESPGAKTRIVIADDNKATLIQMKEALEDGTREIATFQNSFSAEHYLREHGGDVDVVVADFRFRRGPEAQPNGDVLCRIAKEANPAAKTILISGDPGDADKSCVDVVVQKSMDVAVDGSVLRRHVSRFESGFREKV